MAKNIFFDLDGTLITPKIRMYNLFCELVNEFNLSFENYWQLKRQGISQAMLLKNQFNYSQEQINNFRKQWLNKIEDSDRLLLDKAFSYTHKVLELLINKGHKLYIVTARQSKAKTLQQLEKLNIQKYCQDIFVTEQCISKLALIQQSNIIYSQNDIFIGDTGEDILTGQALNIKTIAVTSGMFDQKILKQYNPDIIVDHIGKINWK